MVWSIVATFETMRIAGYFATIARSHGFSTKLDYDIVTISTHNADLAGDMLDLIKSESGSVKYFDNGIK